MGKRRGADDLKLGEGDNGFEAIVAKLEITNRLLAIIVARGDAKQAITVLSGVGLQPIEIAAAVGATPNAVRVALHRARKSTSSSVESKSDAVDQFQGER